MATTRRIRRGEVWLVDLGDLRTVCGDEMYKRRPCVVVSLDSVGILRLRIVVPITTWKDAFAKVPWLVKLEPDARNGLDYPAAADTFQVRSVSEDRFAVRKGVLSAEALEEIVAGIQLVVGAS